MHSIIGFRVGLESLASPPVYPAGSGGRGGVGSYRGSCVLASEINPSAR
jgi:hypothetical protein